MDLPQIRRWVIKSLFSGIFSYTDTQILLATDRFDLEKSDRFRDFEIFNTDKIRIRAQSVKNHQVVMVQSTDFSMIKN